MKNRFTRLLSSTAACLLAVVLAAGCASAPEDTSSVAGSSTSSEVKTAVRIQTIKGPTGIGMVHLMDAQEKGTAQNDYTFTVASSPDEITAKILNDEVDIAAAPTNLAAVLYNRTEGNVTMLAVNTLGVLHILENGDTIQTAADLKGKTIYTTGQGANPEYVLRHILQKNGIDPDKDVTIEFVQENEELAALMDSGTATVAMVPEPTATTVLTKNASIRRALDMTAEWDKVADGQLMMGCVIVRNKFLKEHPDAVKTFLSEYEDSIQAASDIDATAALCETTGIIPKAAVAKQAIPGCNLTFVAGETMKTEINGYFAVLFEANPKSLGGKLPDDAFYYTEA